MPTYLSQTFFWGDQDGGGVQSLVQAAGKQTLKFSALGAIREAWAKYSGVLKALTLQGRQLTTNDQSDLRNVL